MKPSSQSDFHGIAFTAAVTVISRSLILRNKLLRRAAKNLAVLDPRFAVSRHIITSGNETLDAVFVEPEAERARAALLICHGIGETVADWFTVQTFLAEHGVASLVFDYAGYGKSTGTRAWRIGAMWFLALSPIANRSMGKASDRCHKSVEGCLK
jgi:Serine aminopeptidase, S33